MTLQMKSAFVGLVFAHLAMSRATAASFENLDFEEGNWFGGSFPRPDAYVAEQLFPGWTIGNIGGATYDGPYKLWGLAVLMDTGIRSFEEYSTTPVVGRYAFGVSPNAYSRAVGGDPPPVMLQQRGFVPTDAHFLQFVYKGEVLQLEVDGQELPIQALGDRASGDSTVPVYSWYGVDIHEFAGKEATLSFKFLAFEKHVEADWAGRIQTLDGITFLPVPEPGSWGLFGIGLGVVLVCRRGDRRRETGQ